MATFEPSTSAVPWDIRESGPHDAKHVVLLLPGTLCTAAFYTALMSEPRLAGVRLVAATLPGQGGTAQAGDLSIESYAALAGALAADLSCSAVVGHSTGANVALEMAATGEFRGPLVLLAPSLSRVDESKVPRILDKLGQVLGHAPFSAILKIMGPAMKRSLPPDQYATLVAEVRKNDPRVMREHLRSYLAYLDRHGSVAPRLCQSGVAAWVVYGERDDVGITDDERHTLEQCPNTRVVSLPGVGHFIANQRPARVAELIEEALAQSH